MLSRLATLALALLLASPAAAAEIAGTTFADTAEVGGTPLVLNGTALRSKWFVKVYTIGLYLPSKASDAAAVLGSDTPRLARMVLKMDLSADKFGGSIAEAFEGNSANDMAALGDRLTRFKGLFQAGKKNEEFLLAYTPGTGTKITQGGKVLGTIEGKDFADALFGVWIGPGSVDKDLNDGLLGK